MKFVQKTWLTFVGYRSSVSRHNFRELKEEELVREINAVTNERRSSSLTHPKAKLLL